MRLTLVALPSTSNPVPGAVVLRIVASNFAAMAAGRRRTSSSYRARLSRTNSSENGSMTASLYGVMVLVPKVWVETGLALVSATQLAVGSPVMV